MYSHQFLQLKSNVIRLLGNLDSRLTYHNVTHTLDVTEMAEKIARAENITNEKTLFLLKVAALYHDTGFLKVYKGHEEKSCTIFLEETRSYSFSQEDNDLILGLIMATRIPQNPKTHLQQIICDADLDYLGREDFSVIAENLFQESVNYGFVTSKEEWDDIQLNFIKNHHYHTLTSKQWREPVMQKHYSMLATH